MFCVYLLNLCVFVKSRKGTNKGTAKLKRTFCLQYTRFIAGDILHILVESKVYLKVDFASRLLRNFMVDYALSGGIEYESGTRE